MSTVAIWRGALLSVAIVSAIPLVCLVFVARGRWARAISVHLMGLAAGALLASALGEFIPESIGRVGSGWRLVGLVALGFGVFFAIEQLIRFHLTAPSAAAGPGIRPYVVLNLIGVTLHNAIDGMVIAAGFTAGAGLGVTATIAIVLHEIPHEIGNFGVFVHGGVSPIRAVLLNVLLAVAAILGTVMTLAIGMRSASIAAALLPVAAGNFIYVALVDLVPELYREQTPAGRTRSFVVMICGAIVTLIPALLIG